MATHRSEGPTISAHHVVVVPARDAWDEYDTYGIYICQPGRRFREVEYLAFYRSKRIEAVVPRIIGVYDHVEMSRGNAGALSDGNENDRAVSDLITRLLDEGERSEGDCNQVFLLTQPDDADTVLLRRELPHRQKGPWLRNLRYVTLSRLAKAETTADL